MNCPMPRLSDSLTAPISNGNPRRRVNQTDVVSLVT